MDADYQWHLCEEELKAEREDHAATKESLELIERTGQHAVADLQHERKAHSATKENLELVECIVADLQHERQAHKKTAKQFVDMQAVHGCMAKRVDTFIGTYLGGVLQGTKRNDEDLNKFICDLERMLGVEQEKEA